MLAWAERFRAGSLLVRPVRPPDDTGLADDLAQLRHAASEVERATLSGLDTRPLERMQEELEESIKERVRGTPGTGIRSAAGAPPARELAGALADRALLEFVQLDGTLLPRHARPGPRAPARSSARRRDVEETLEALRFALHTIALGRGSERSLAAAHASARDCARAARPRAARPGAGGRRRRGSS